MLWKQQVAGVAAIAFGVGCAAQVFAQEAAVSHFQANTPEPGFYGGIALRENAQDTVGISLGRLSSAWGKFVAPTADESGSRALMFGGYRWRNDVALEAAFGTAAESYALAPGARRGVGLSLAGTSESTTGRTWNADVYTSWSFRPSFALYGRLGYVQSDAAAAFVSALPSIDRRTRDGVNYGVGLRYDVTPALGLRLEYARFGRFAGENIGGFLPESDQVQFGMQFRF
ncbi:MAG: porin family protein [Betaproteobacteria bacterium]|nr:MAG: porin family protein [Betaproteobacteria bacterium]